MGTFLDRWRSPDAALLILRLWLGLVGVLHGSQKLFGAFGGTGIPNFAESLGKMNVPAPTAAAYAAALSEFLGGLLVGLGILPRLAAIPFLFTMVVAWATAHHFKFFGQSGGGEYPLTLAVALLVVVIAGPGRYTLSSCLRRPPPVRS
jgi:putative oxidoreductase